jgi:hypothetical protein
MVSRKLNKPVFKIHQYPVFWVREILASEWHCHNCYRVMEKGTVAFEVIVRFARKDANAEKDIPLKKYICLSCAEKMLEESLEVVKIIKVQGVESYKVLTRL